MAWLETLVRVDTFTGTGLLTYLLIFISFSLAFFYVFRRQHKVWLIEQIPGPKGLPILGNALEINVQPTELFKRLVFFCDHNIMGPLVRMWIGTKPYVLIFKPKAAEVLLSSQKHIDKSSDYSYLHPWLGTGLLTSTGRKWQHRRKLLTPAFHFRILEDFVEVFHQQSAKFVKNLEVKADGQPFDIFRHITLLTLDIILETAMGRCINAQDNSESDYVKAVYRIGAIVQRRQTRPWLQPNFLFKLLGNGREHDECLRILHGFSNDTIRERRREYLEFKKVAKDANGVEDAKEVEVLGKRKRLAFLDLLLEFSEERGSLSDEDIREEVDTFMFEGHDTTAAAISWGIYLLGCHPEIQAKVFEELEGIFGNSDRPATMADLREMKFLECCIKEALRLFPSVPFIARELQEDIYIDGFRVPAHTTAMIITYRLHRDPTQFPDPEFFKPERFLPENSIKRHPYAYVPFSAGPRNCIGQKFALMEEKVVLSSLFRKYRVESTTRREDLKILGELVLRPENGNTVRLFPRVK